MDGSPSINDFLGGLLDGEEEFSKDVGSLLDLINKELSKKGNHINMILQAANISVKQGSIMTDASVDAVYMKINSVLAKGEQVEYLKKTAENLPLKAGTLLKCRFPFLKIGTQNWTMKKSLQ